MVGLVAIPSAALASKDSLDMALTWQPTSHLDDGPSLFSADRWNGSTATADFLRLATMAVEGQSLQLLPLADERTVTNIGENTEKKTPRPVTTSSQVAAFVTQHLADALQELHASIVDRDGSRQLGGSVKQFFVNEESSYRGTVVLQLTLTDAKGRALWTGSATGHAEHNGHSFSAENYAETLSDSVVDAVRDLFKSQAFLDAFHGGKVELPPPPPSVSKGALEVKLHWTAKAEVNGAGARDALEGHALRLPAFKDTRKAKPIGENVEKKDPRPVETLDDVAAFVTEHVSDKLQEAHADVVTEGANVTLQGAVQQFFVREDDRYHGTVVLRFTLSDAKGKTLWSGLATGHSSKFGHSYDPGNYNDALSDAVVDAVNDLLQSRSFLAAVSGRGHAQSR
ncbi:MAG: hypothetical protein ACYDCL_01375 [Myxococcales bacterium]